MGTRITIYLGSDQKGQLERAALERNSSEAVLLREALEQETRASRRQVPYLGIIDGDPYLSSHTDDVLKSIMGRTG